MRIVAYCAILIALLFAPVHRLDVAKLEPVEIVYVSQTVNSVTVSTDTGAWGRGKTIAAALEMLHDTTPGVVYLDTAEYLLFNRTALPQIEKLRSHLHGSVRICLAEALDFQDLAKYLEAHADLPKLQTWKQGSPLPELKNGKIV